MMDGVPVVSKYFPEATKNENTFDGWYTDSAKTQNYDPLNSPSYAKWIPNNYTVTFIDGDEVYQVSVFE